jgi:hypothetical protein
MPNNERASGKTGSKKLILRREALKTLAPVKLDEVRAGYFTQLCEIVTAPDSWDGPWCRPW